MATAHALSVLTNSSVKLPINPVNGLPNTMHERPMPVWTGDGKDSEDCSENYDMHQGSDRTSKHSRRQRISSGGGSQLHGGSAVISPRDPMIESLTKDLGSLSDDEFYRKLQALKNEHKKTLAICEKAYHDRTSTGPISLGVGSQDRGREDAASALFMATTQSVPQDRVRDMSRPPLPPGAHRSAWARSSIDAASDEDDGENSADDRGRHDRRHSSRSPLPGERERPRSGSLSSSLSNGMARVEDMWDKFCVDDYAPKERRSGAWDLFEGSSVSRKRPTSAASSSSKENREWSPKITMPQPFRMTLRDEAKTTKKRTKAQEELDRSIQEKRLQEDAECQKKFKATPAPANIYLPLYEEIVEKEQTRRDTNHAYRSEILRSMEKPFKFLQREEDKKRSMRTQSLPVHAALLKEKTKFKARPVPKEVQEEVLDRLAEEEEYRKIRTRMRAEETLRQARLPPSMEARELGRASAARIASASEEESSGDEPLPGQPTFRPRIKRDVPDFEEMHRKLQWQLAGRKAEKESTVVKPFALRTDRISSHKDKIHEDIAKDENMLTELRWPFKNPRTKPKNIGVVVSPADQIPANQTTASTELRKSATKQKLSELARQELEALETERGRRPHDRKLQSVVSEKVAANEVIYNLKDQTEEKLRRYRAEERARQEEYRKHLNEMKQRVDGRPLLFEMVTQKNARMQAEKKYDNTIENAGLRREFVRDKAALTASRDKCTGGYGSDGSEAGSYRESLHRTSRIQEAHRGPLTKEETGLSDSDFSQESDNSDKLEN